MEFLAVLSLVAGGGLWPPAPVPPDATDLGLRIRAIAKGTPLDQVERRLGLTGSTPSTVVGTSISHTVTYSVGRTHSLQLLYTCDTDGWTFHNAVLRTDGIDWSLPWQRPPKP